MSTTTTLSAPDIHCDGCANAIKKALGKTPGIADVAVNVEAKTVTVTHDAPLPTVTETLDKIGFPATVVSS
jgi:copper chaperone CopZ